MDINTSDRPPPEVIKDYSEQLANLNTHLRAEIKLAQAIYAEQSDKHRISPPVYHVGDEVWLLRKHIHTKRPSDKLDHKRLGRFKILAKISSHAYKLELPASMKVHPVFHVSLLEPAASDSLSGQVQPIPPSVGVDVQPEWKAEEILDSRYHYRKHQYLVKWVGFE